MGIDHLAEDPAMEDDQDVDHEDSEVAKAMAAKRAQELGFRPQKEHVYNKLLPYAGPKMDGESARWFAEIKANLTLSLANREISPGFDTWAGRLNAYIHYYSYKFSKEDHVALVKLYFSFITTPDLELWIVNKMGE